MTMKSLTFLTPFIWSITAGQNNRVDMHQQVKYLHHTKVWSVLLSLLKSHSQFNWKYGAHFRTFSHLSITHTLPWFKYEAWVSCIHPWIILAISPTSHVANFPPV
jgi:hypothetical protein